MNVRHVSGSNPVSMAATQPYIHLMRVHAVIGSLFVALLLSRGAAFGQARVQITEGNVAPLPIAIPNFVAGTPADNEVGNGVEALQANP